MLASNLVYALLTENPGFFFHDLGACRRLVRRRIRCILVNSAQPLDRDMTCRIGAPRYAWHISYGVLVMAY